MASSSKNPSENHHRSPSHPPPIQTPPPLPFNSIPAQITPTALLALPFISILAGVSTLHPTKAIYALYSPVHAFLLYVHGDGTLTTPLNLCPLLAFASNPNDPLCSRQRLNIIECMNRSARYQQLISSPSWSETGIHKQEFRAPFTNANAVKKAMTYVSDLRFGPDCMAALRTLPLDLHLNSNLPDNRAPYVQLTANAVWDFSVNHADFPAPHLEPTSESKLLEFFQTCIQRYRNTTPYATFKKAAHVLAGMEQVGGIIWRNGHEGAKTHAGWSVDDFLVRFAKYEQFTREWKFLHAPSPIAWLEAEMADEFRKEKSGGRRRKLPWKGLIDGVELVGVMRWEDLKKFYWGDEEDGRGYPRVLASEGDENEDVEAELALDVEAVETPGVPIKNEGPEETSMRNADSYQQPKFVGEVRKRKHGKHGKRSREERVDSAAAKRARCAAALNLISGPQ